MKKIIENGLLITVSFVLINGSNTYSQFYSFTQNKSEYKKLDSAAINDSLYISEEKDVSITIPIGFKFKFHNEEIDKLQIFRKAYSSPGFYLPEPVSSSNIYNTIIVKVAAEIKDDMYLENFSPLHFKYETMGSIGDQIFIFEWQELSYYSKFYPWARCGRNCDPDTTVKYFCNYQLWLYEKTGDIEIRFGKSFFPGIAATVIRINRSYFMSISLDGTFGNITSNDGENYYDTPIPGWPSDSIIYKFYRNTSDQIFLNDYYLLFNHSGVYSGFGAGVGQNNFLDYEWAEKFYTTVPFNLKGMISQNFGSSISNDSAGFSIFSVGENGLPDKALYTSKRPYKCLKLDGTLNYIAFDSVLNISDSFFVSFSLKPYSSIFNDTIGLFISQTSSIERFKGRTAVRCFNHNWYDVYSISYLSSWSGDDRNDDCFHFNMAPVINFDLENSNKLNDTTLCGSSLTDILIGDLKQNENSNKVSLTVKPNVASEFISITLKTDDEANAVLSIIDLYGRIIDSFSILHIMPGEYNKTVNLQKYSNGIYHIVFQQNRKTKYVSFIINK